MRNPPSEGARDVCRQAGADAQQRTRAEMLRGLTASRATRASGRRGTLQVVAATTPQFKSTKHHQRSRPKKVRPPAEARARERERERERESGAPQTDMPFPFADTASFSASRLPFPPFLTFVHHNRSLRCTLKRRALRRGTRRPPSTSPFPPHRQSMRSCPPRPSLLTSEWGGASAL